MLNVSDCTSVTSLPIICEPTSLMKLTEALPKPRLKSSGLVPMYQETSLTQFPIVRVAHHAFSPILLKERIRIINHDPNPKPSGSSAREMFRTLPLHVQANVVAAHSGIVFRIFLVT